MRTQSGKLARHPQQPKRAEFRLQSAAGINQCRRCHAEKRANQRQRTSGRIAHANGADPQRSAKRPRRIEKEKRLFWAKLFGKTQEPILAFMQKFTTVSDQVDAISNRLESQKQNLLIDINRLDRLYEVTLKHYRELAHFIAAGEAAKRHADEVTLPVLKERAEKNNTMENAQVLRDYQSQRDELERRLQDLLLTRQVAMQSLPSIRLIQENDKGLVNKINTTLVNTVPLWRQQLAQSLAIHRSSEAAQALKASSDLTNELLLKNAENLQMANRETREQIERGVFDIQAVEEANRRLIATIEESIELNANAQKAREDVKQRLQEAEAQLKSTLKHAAE